jgi:hypothetical protein
VGVAEEDMGLVLVALGGRGACVGGMDAEEGREIPNTREYALIRSRSTQHMRCE